MPTLRLVYDVPGCACHGNARSLAEHAPPDFGVSMSPLRIGNERLDWDRVLGDEPVDLLFLFDFGQAASARDELRRRGGKTTLMAAWSLAWPTSLSTFYHAYCLTDSVLVSSRECWEGTGGLPNTYSIPYGVDSGVFNVRTPIHTRTPRVLWVGSEMHRALTGDDDLLVPLRRKLAARGIPCERLLVDSFGADKRTPEQMSDWYNTGTILVCASETEDTPNPALEAAACGCTVVSTRVGSMPELIRNGINGYLVERDVDAILEGVLTATEGYVRLATQMQADIVPWRWTHRSHDFFEMFRGVLGMRDPGGPVESRRLPDLSDKVTVFVTTVGAPTFRECLDHLCRQDVKFRLEIIEGVAPLGEALQHMLDRCNTPYFVQVDEDMLLFPHAIRALCERIEATTLEVAIYVGNLYDVHLGRGIQGVKIARHDIVRKYPWSTEPSLFARNRRIEEDGYRIVWEPSEQAMPSPSSVFGLHAPERSPRLLYERYLTLERWRRLHGDVMGWFEAHPPAFFRRFLEEPNEANYLAVMGVIAGTLGRQRPGPATKDFRLPVPGLELARRLFEELGSAGDG